MKVPLMLRHSLQKPKQLIEQSSFSGRQLLLFILVFGGIGITLLVKAYASGPLASFEAENSTLSSNTTVGTDAIASGGKYIQFSNTGGGTGGGAIPPYRFMYSSYDDGVGGATAAANGFNLMDAGSVYTADHSPAGTKGLVWIGDYDNTTCNWEQSDATVQTVVKSAIGDSNVAGYFISDEPEPWTCPTAYSQHKARSDMIHQLDSSKFVVIVLDSNSGSNSINQLSNWKGIGDYIGLDPYPCYTDKACDYSWIDQTIQAANSAGLNYWGIVQAFRDNGNWRWPTSTELAHMLNQWKASNQKGYMAFAWDWAGYNLTDQPALLSTLKSFNEGTLP